MSLGMIYACIKPQIEVLGSSYLDLLKMLEKNTNIIPNRGLMVIYYGTK